MKPACSICGYFPGSPDHFHFSNGDKCWVYLLDRLDEFYVAQSKRGCR